MRRLVESRQFPFIFSAVAVLFAICALTNGKIVERVGIDKIVNRALLVIGVLLVVLLGVTASAGGRPSFWVFMPLFGVTLASFLFVFPNLGSASMTPVGHLAGSGSALTGAVRLGGGSAVALVIVEFISASLTAFVTSLVVLVAAASVTVWLVQRGAQRRALHEVSLGV